MSETTAQYLSRLHASIGVQIDATAIEGRSTALNGLTPNITVAQAITAAATATGLVTDLGKIEWLVQPMSIGDPSFVPVQVDKATAVACSAVTTALLTGSDSRSLAAALVVLSAGMGRGKQILDDRLKPFAQKRLWATQQMPLPEAKFSAPNLQINVENLKALTDALTAGNAPAAATPMKSVVDALNQILAAQNKAIANAFEGALVRQSIVEQETQMQWWVVGKASDDLRRPFAELPPFEAAARAAQDLSKMISKSRPAGPFAAPALLKRVLHSEDAGRAQAQQFSDAVLGIPLAERRAIFARKPSTTAVPSALPIMLAAEYSIESEDAADWQPRFKRSAHVDVTAAITPVEFAEQLFREFLLWKLLPA
ncbi:GTPase-associated system all-helical protein GASH [Burkholderia gladioli]|uniref:GTPase-associated system all-helical protein GASH n=1 Tax=Burkholderia gladioli TaxID=28095 RepID=UPI002656C2F5|nr:GTPase-associated system all-helical protein GASH [Burkholderia gladioli]MDN7752662.1 GTPase-associated system all-helical protein GASH [Burkholderia gladioli]